jgi:hypothetical protein
MMCRNCDAEFLVKQANVGESVRCPHCEDRVTVTDDEFVTLPPVEGNDGLAPYALTSAPKDSPRKWKPAREVDPIDEEDDERGWDEPREGSWGSVKTGITLVLVATILGSILFFVGAYLLSKGDASTGQTLLIVSMILGGLLTAIGQGLCISIPPKVGGKGLAGTATVLSGVSLLIGMVIMLAGTGVIVLNLGPEVGSIVLILYVVTAVVATLIWVLFLIHLALHLGAKVLAVFTGIFGALFFAFVMFVVVKATTDTGMGRGMGSRDNDALMGLSLIAGIVYYIVLLIIHLVMVGVYGGVRRSR